MNQLGNSASQIISMDCESLPGKKSWTVELMETVELTGFGLTSQAAQIDAFNQTVDFLRQIAECVRQNLASSLSGKIYQAILKQWKCLPAKSDASFSFLAAFVVTSDRDVNPRVLSLGTGSKWIESKNIQDNGKVVHDSHAEIVARRALCCYLYETLETLAKNPAEDSEELLLEAAPGGRGYRLKPHLKLHLYVSSPPCGDSRMYQYPAVSHPFPL